MVVRYAKVAAAGLARLLLRHIRRQRKVAYTWTPVCVQSHAAAAHQETAQGVAEVHGEKRGDGSAKGVARHDDFISRVSRHGCAEGGVDGAYDLIVCGQKAHVGRAAGADGSGFAFPKDVVEPIGKRGGATNGDDDLGGRG